MIQTIDELIFEIKKVLPQANTIKQFKPDEKGDYVSFQWNGRDFVVSKGMEAFEMKNNRLFVTGASILMQSALSTRDRNQHILEACLETVRKAEDLLGKQRTLDQGLKMLAATKAALSKLARR